MTSLEELQTRKMTAFTLKYSERWRNKKAQGAWPWYCAWYLGHVTSTVIGPMRITGL